MPLMKAQHTQAVRQSAIVMDLSDLEREAASILSHARSEATQLVAQARQEAQREAQRITQEARQAGYTEGLQAGLEEGRRQGHDEALAATSEHLKTLAARWSQALETLHEHMPAHIADARSDLIRLAVAIAGRVIHEESLRNRRIAPAVALETLRLAGAARRVALHVHPVEIDSLERYLPELLSGLRSIEEVELTPDEAVGAGGCVLRFGAGEIDARMETQLQRISDELLQATGDAASPGDPAP